MFKESKVPNIFMEVDKVSEDQQNSIEASDSVKTDSSEEGFSNMSRRKFLAAGSTAAAAGLAGCTGPGFTEYGEFEIGIRRPILDRIPFTNYYSPELEDQADEIEAQADENLNGRTVASGDNIVKMDLDYYTDDEVFSWMESSENVVGDEEAITRLVDWKHYSIIRMGIEAGGFMEDIPQYLEKDLQTQYANNAAEPFYEALNITNEVANNSFDINPASDERDDQFIGMNLYMLGTGNSRAGRYFNTSEIEGYAEGSLDNLQDDLEEEATQQGGFSFEV